MSVLSDARRLLRDGIPGYEPFFTQYQDGKLRDTYWICLGWIERPLTGAAIGHHAADCPWSRGKRVIEVLEAAERVASIYEDLKRGEGRMGRSEEEWAALETLTAALKGDEVAV
jgi:hypothetical protein